VRDDVPLVFIGHSYGGIIIQNALVQLSQSFSTQSEHLLRCVAGVLFFGTPQSELVLAHLQQIRSKKQKSPVQVLPKSISKEYLKTLIENFVRISQNLRIACFFENDEDGLPGRFCCSGSYGQAVDEVCTSDCS